MQTDFAVTTKNEEETILLGKQIASSLKPGDIIALFGDLGSGKTRFVKGVCEEFRVNDMINSPTFMIVNEYLSGEGVNIYHFDLYRMKTENEILAMGFMEYLDGSSIVLIEWPEHIERLLPEKTIKIHFSHSSENENYRWIKIHRP